MSNKTKIDQTLQAFVSEHADGWSHDEWLGLLNGLAERGVDVSQSEKIGHALERERLAAKLVHFKIKGLGPRRIDAIVDHFGNLYSASRATAADFADIPTIPTKLAETLEHTLSA